MMPEKIAGSSPENMFGGLGRIERAVLYTQRNVVVLCMVGAVCSGILSFVIVNPLSLFAVPFYAYFALSVSLVVMMWRRLTDPGLIIALKVLIDAALTVYWIDLYMWKTGSMLLYFLPIVVLLTVVLYNLRFDEHRLVLFFIYTLVIGNGFVFLFFSEEKKPEFVCGGVYMLIASLVIWAHSTHSNFKKMLHNDLASKEERIDSFMDSRKTFALSARIVNHEISNELMSLSHCAHLLKHRKTESFVRELDDIKRCMDSIPKYLKMLSEQQTAPTGLLAVLKVVFPGKHASVDVDGDVAVNVPMLLLVSFVNNIYENALQAYERTFGNDEGFHLDVTFDGAALIIDDNAGGFDVSTISLGSSSKGSGHGIFLATFLNDTAHLGLRPSIERIERGTRVKIVFDRIEKIEQT